MVEEKLKITEKELKDLQEFNQTQGNIIQEMGLLQVKQHELSHHYAESLNKFQVFKEGLQESYGLINIDLTDGSYELVEQDADEEDVVFEDVK
jgi:hypothetical protein